MGKSAGGTAADKGPDNNKRLAQLEEGVALLAIAVATANGVDVSTVEDPIAAAINSIETMVATLAERDGAIEQAQTVREELQRQLDASGSRIAELEDLNKAAVEAIGAAPSMLANALAAAGVELKEGDDPVLVAIDLIATSTDPRAEAVDLPDPAARDCGPTFGQANAAELLALTKSAESFEIVFSDGEREIVALQPLIVTGADLVVRGSRQVMLEPPIEAKNPPVQVEIAGFGLLLGGEQVAYSPLLEPVTLYPGETRKFHRTTVFAAGSEAPAEAAAE